MSGSRHFLLCRGAPPPRSVAARSRSRRWFVAMACLVSGSVAGAVSTRARLQAGLDAQQASPTVAELRAKFEQRLQQISSRVDGVVGYSVLDLTSGDRIAHLERETFPTASTIKLAVVYELFRQAAEGRIRLDDTIALDRAKAVGGTGVLFQLGTPTLSVRDYATLMVIVSDNTATNVLVDLLGMDAIGARMRGLGLNATKLRRHMIDLAAARRGDENVSTPDEIVRLLAMLHGSAGPNASGAPDGNEGARRPRAARREEAVARLEKPRAGRAPTAPPPGVRTAGEPGVLE